MSQEIVTTINSLDTLQAAVQTGFTPAYVFFWGHQVRADGQVGKSCLSQWLPAPFVVDGVQYVTAEHYMMAEKARLFGDEETRQRILQAEHPKKAKQLGREVRGFVGEDWEAYRLEVVVQGNLAKFRQNEGLRMFLLETYPQVLVEASPVDRVWGIGLAEDDPRALDVQQWQGLNLLGFALMVVRTKLQGEF